MKRGNDLGGKKKRGGLGFFESIKAMTSNPKVMTYAQNPIIENYNLFAKALATIGIKVTQLNEEGICEGLTSSYILNAHEGRQHEFLGYLKFIEGLKTKDQIDALVQLYDQKRKENVNFFVKSEVEGEPVVFHKLIRFVEGVQAAQEDNAFAKSILANWDKTYSFLCSRKSLARKLKEANIQGNQLLHVLVGTGHAFAIEKKEEGFYVFEPNSIKPHATDYIPLPSEEAVAKELVKNMEDWGALSPSGNEPILLGIHFLSFGDKNRELDDALTAAGDSIKIFSEMVARYHSGFISRLDFALQLHEEIAALEIKSAELEELEIKLIDYIDSNDHPPQIISEREARASSYTKYCESYWLSSAAFNGQQEVVRELLDKGADPNCIDSKGLTPLNLAAMMGHSRIVTLLLEKGASPNTNDNRDKGALVRACSRGHLEVVKLLIANGADLNVKDKDDGTPITRACTNGHFDIAKLLLENGAKPVTHDGVWGNDRPLIIWAAKKGYAEIVNALLSSHSCTKRDVWDALLGAVRFRQTEITRLLIQAGVDPNSGENNKTVLNTATEHGDIETVKVLLEAGAEIQCRNIPSESSLTIAQRKGYSEIEKLFREHETLISSKTPGK